MKTCAPITRQRVTKFALNIFMQTSKCILSFSASSSKVWIQPWSRCRVRRHRKCLNIAAIKPGTPAKLSRTIKRHSTAFTGVFWGLNPVTQLKLL
eukprot:Skav229210  [mRNA]  locus=scaffold2439:84087:84371:- [translate_table: standard]